MESVKGEVGDLAADVDADMGDVVGDIDASVGKKSKPSKIFGGINIFKKKSPTAKDEVGNCACSIASFFAGAIMSLHEPGHQSNTHIDCVERKL